MIQQKSFFEKAYLHFYSFCWILLRIFVKYYQLLKPFTIKNSPDNPNYSALPSATILLRPILTCIMLFTCAAGGGT